MPALTVWFCLVQVRLSSIWIIRLLVLLDPVPPVAVKPVMAKFGAAATEGLSKSGIPLIPSWLTIPEFELKVRSVMNLLNPKRNSFKRLVWIAYVYDEVTLVSFS